MLALTASIVQWRLTVKAGSFGEKMYPIQPEEEYRVDIPAIGKLGVFMAVWMVVQIFPARFVFELWVDNALVWQFSKERAYFL